ncbi:MAG: methyltransferase domain-containing protein [Candidatus Micrarchaeia archaeon]|jgi:SAM-dependent methyltransferase
MEKPCIPRRVVRVPRDWQKDFFGKHYTLGDNSRCGYLPGRKETLKERTEREAGGVIRLLGLEPGASILDVPCGYGRHSIRLSEKGYRVTGLDINDEELAIAREEAERRGVRPEFVKQDMRGIGSRLLGRFDAVINMFFSFGFFYEERENVQAMAGFYGALKQGGRMLIHSDVSREMIERGGNYKLEEVRELENGNGKLIIEEEFDLAAKRLNGSWTLVDDAGNRGTPKPYSMRIYSAEEYSEMAFVCGFRSVEIYGSFEGVPFMPDSAEIIVVARK